VRWTVLIALCLAPVAAAAAPASDPAFLGIGMGASPAGCQITSITPGSPARDAGLLFGDIVLGIDGVRIGGPNPCDLLAARIADHHPGDKITLTVDRGVERVTVKAALTSRGEMLSRRLVGEPLSRTELIDADNDEVTYDLSRRGQTRIVGWFTLASCAGCARTFDRVSARLEKRFKDNPPSVLAITSPVAIDRYRSIFTSSVPLAIVDEDLFDNLALRDSQRITFMVIDNRGVVRFAAPVAPDGDDVDAAIDDILAAAEQAEHQRARR
jgi:hypothetical protein